MTQDSEFSRRETLEGTGDADIARLLQDAYEVPAVPKSLLKRLDRSVSEQWGPEQWGPEQWGPEQQRGSLEVARREPSWRTAARRLARFRHISPIAAGLMLTLLLILAIRRDAHAYGWSAIVEALSKQPLVQLVPQGTSESAVAWLSLSQEKVGQRVGEDERLYDFDQRFVLVRGPQDNQIRRFRLSDVSAAADRQRVALSFLLGDLAVESQVLQLPDLRLLRESSTRAGEFVAVEATFGGDRNSAEQLQVSLVVDPSTHLPRSYEVRDAVGSVRRGVLTYPNTSLKQLVTSAFPPNLPIIEGEGSLVSLASVAAAPARDAIAANATDAAVASVEDHPDKLRPGTAPLQGAASLNWSPVVAMRLRNDEHVAAIDGLLERIWAEQGIGTAAPASEDELLRRVYLDLTGRTPTVAEVRKYSDDPSADRYERLVDQLLASPDHATHLATVWRTFLLPEGVDLSRFGGIPAFDAWLAEQFAHNLPYDQLVRELLLAEGRLTKSGPLLFYSALKLDADQIATRTARVFLGIRLDCAQCHDDFFEPWKQEDFWSYAAFFARISRPQAPLESVSTLMRVHDIDRGEVTMPDGEEPVSPKFLDGSPIDDSPTAAARRQQLARWLTSADNPYFARATVNRVWAHLFGRGIVDPVDGFGKLNPPRSPELLDHLAGQLVGNGFDLRQSFRTMVLSRAYRLSSGSETADAKRQEWFAQMNVKMLTAEQVYDCITVATMLVGSDANGFSIARINNTPRDEFLAQFKTLAGRATEYQGGIPQALTLMNGSLISSATDLANSGLLKSLEAPFFTDDQRVEVIYLATLSRRPSTSEWDLLRDYIRDRDPQTSIQEPLADILWAVLNGAEFTMNH